MRSPSRPFCALLIEERKPFVNRDLSWALGRLHTLGPSGLAIVTDLEAAAILLRSDDFDVIMVAHTGAERHLLTSLRTVRKLASNLPIVLVADKLSCFAQSELRLLGVRLAISPFRGEDLVVTARRLLHDLKLTELCPGTKPRVVTRRGRAIPRRDEGSTVLIVGHEVVLRAVIRSVLERRGYGVLEGSNGSEARAFVKDPCRAISLLLIDYVLPNATAMDLAHSLRSERGDVSIICSSGWRLRLEERATFPPGTRFLTRPFTPTQLVTKVHSALD